MPSAVYVPSKWNDLSTDVNVGTPAQGAVAYFGGSFWNSLAPGTNGQVLTSGGPGANPSWTTVAGGGGAFVSLAPAPPTANTIVPAGDTVPALLLKRHSATQTARALAWQDETGLEQGFIDPSGFLGAPYLLCGSDLSAAFQNDNPASILSGYDVISTGVGGGPGGGFGAFAQIGRATPGSPPNSQANIFFSKTDFYAYNSAVTALPLLLAFSAGVTGHYNDDGTSNNIFTMTGGTAANIGITCEGNTPSRVLIGWSGAGFPTAPFDGQLGIMTTGQPAVKGLTIHPDPAQTAPQQEWQDSSGVAQTAVAANGRDFVLDTVTGTRWGTASTQKQAFYGAVPVVRPALAAAATDLASVIALANSLRGAQIALGLGA